MVDIFKRFSILLFALMFLVMNTPNAFADVIHQLPEDVGLSGGGGNSSADDSHFTFSNFSCGEKLITDELQDDIETYKKEEANMAEKFMTTQIQNVIRVGDLNGLSTLVFGNPYCVWGGNLSNGYDATMASNGVFTAQEQENIIDPLMKLLGGCFVFLMVLAMLISGLKVGLTSVKGRALGEFGEDFYMWGVAIILALGYDMLLNVIFQMNAALVISIRDLISSQGANVDQISLLYDFKAIHAAMGMGPYLLLMLAEWILALILNFVYLARKVVILILMVMGLIAIYSLLFAKTRAFFGTWIREFFGNVFLQSIHALVLYTMVMFAATGSSTIFKLGLLMMFIPISGMISKWLNIGDSSSKLGSTLTMMGLGGVMSTMMLASQAGNIMRGGSMNGGNSSFNSSDGGNAMNALNSSAMNSLANDTGNTAITTSASGANSSMWNSTREGVGKAGMMIGAGAGLIAGPAGAVLGAKAGQFIAQNGLQMARNIPAGATNLVSSIQQGQAFASPNGTGFGAMFSRNADAGALMARRETMGNIGESLGSMFGIRAASIGRSLGSGLSGVSREHLANSQAIGLGLVNPETGAPNALSFSQLATRFPDAEARWVQSNQGSAMFVNTADGWQQVGLRGAADTSLNDGEFRAMDYKLANPSMEYQLQPNGTYRAPVMDNDVLSSINNSNIPSFSEAMGSTSTTSFLQNNAAVAGASLNDTIIGNGSLQSMGVKDFATNNSMVGSVSMNDVISSSPSLANQQADTFFASNPGIAQGLGVDMNDSSLSRMSVGNYLATNPQESVMDLGAVMSHAATDSATVGDFVANNPAMGDLSMGTFMQSAGDMPIEQFTALNPDISSAMGVSSSDQPVVVGTSNQQMETVGLKGSSESLFRTSNAYIVGGNDVNGSSHINAGVIQHISQQETPRYQDTNFRAESVNPDQHLFHNTQGASRASGSDHLANSVRSAGAVKNQWAEKLSEQINTRRIKKIG